MTYAYESGVWEQGDILKKCVVCVLEGSEGDKSDPMETGVHYGRRGNNKK